jgi:hypothetical protein
MTTKPAVAKSISLKQFTSSVQAAVKSAVQKHPKFQAATPQGITFGHLIRGFPVPDNFTVAETQAFANDVASHLTAAHPELAAVHTAGGSGVVFCAGGHVICGIPAVDSFLLTE